VAELDVAELVEAVTRRVLAQLASPGEVSAMATAAYDPSRPLVAANWKMNACAEGIVPYLADLAAADSAVDLLLFPPAVLLRAVADEVVRVGRSDFAVGSQDLHPQPSGAHTGEHSGGLIRAAGGSWTLVGHSERREAGETDAQVCRKIHAGLDADLSVMLCVGESMEARRAGATFRVLRNQLLAALGDSALQPPAPQRLSVAYEPLWAIGTGEVATLEQIQEATAFVRRVVSEIYDFARARDVRVVYGGSVKPGNAQDIMSCPDVNGLLVGGASLKGASFCAIADASAPVGVSRRQP
jgi:triosephosphate isomerase (TIM)